MSVALEQPGRMPLTEHLRDLRKRLVRCLLLIALVFCGLFPFAQTLYTYISEPLRRYLPEGASMIATSVTSPFLAPFKLTAMCALFLAMPLLLHQAWGFIALGCTAASGASPCRCCCRASCCSTAAWRSRSSWCSR